MGRDGKQALGELLEDRNAASPTEGAIDADLRSKIAYILATLSPREEKVIRMRFGIGFEREHTLQEIGREFKLTRERIRQIEAEAFQGLDDSNRSPMLRRLHESRS